MRDKLTKVLDRVGKRTKAVKRRKFNGIVQNVTEGRRVDSPERRAMLDTHKPTQE